MCVSVLIAQETHPEIKAVNGMHATQYSMHRLCCISFSNSKELWNNNRDRQADTHLMTYFPRQLG